MADIQTHNLRSKDDQDHCAHSSMDQTSGRPSYMTHGQSSSIQNYQMPPSNGYRPSTSYSDTPTARKHSAYPSAGEYTPYQTYSYPVPQHHGQQRHHQHQNQPFQYQSQISLPQPLPSAGIDISDFFGMPPSASGSGMPPSASGPGMNLENYQVVSGTKSARHTGGMSESMSRGSSASGSADTVQTPRPGDEADGQGNMIVEVEGK